MTNHIPSMVGWAAPAHTMGWHLVPGWAWTYPASGSQVGKGTDRGQDGTGPGWPGT